MDDSCIEIVLPPTFTSSILTNTQSNESNVLSTSTVINSHHSSSIFDDNKISIPVDDNTHKDCQGNQLPMDQTNQYNDNQTNSTTIASPVVASVHVKSSSSSTNSPSSNWRPLLLFVPLRLGLHNPNPCYFNAIKVRKIVSFCIFTNSVLYTL